MQSDVKHEQIKLAANALNGIGVGTILSSVVAPYIGIAIGSLRPEVDWLNLAGVSAFGLLLGVICLFEAQRRLEKLELAE
ncbi:hypothetical protein [Devosia sp. MC1541]|uniref:hypothetical protein n=1 Tax=Devosia sp. MC1541 TaxID=2725264 RepID=UPI00145C8AAD|nr:hypothetical protein [Devosia sp. MC1541]